MKKQPQRIQNIIFDFGGVLLDIDYEQTVSAFKRLGMKNPNEAFSKEVQAEFFREFEKGKITENVFITEIQKQLKDSSREDVIRAWNALLGNLPEDRFLYLQRLKLKYRLFLLSNTNIIHEKEFMKIIDAGVGWDAFSQLFEGIGYSHKMHMRKPDLEIFYTMLEKYELKPHETCFIDDTKMHVEAARKTGITAFHLEDGKEIWDVLSHLE